MNKVIKDGKTGILISSGVGAGWSSWSKNYTEEMMFDPYIINAVENNHSFEEVSEYLEKQYPTEYFNGYHNLIVKWIPNGTQFRIKEYDGHETLITKYDDIWFTA